MYEAFYSNDVIKRLAREKRWTISDYNKVPIDMTDLLMSQGQAIHGALTKKEGHNPFVDLYTITKYMPNAINNAYCIDAKTDGIMVLDIEPKCPKVIADKLLQLPALYGEFSMSGKGYHLIFQVPKEYEDVYSCTTAVKEKHGYYEFLCNHCVTFTRNVIPAGYVPNIGQGSYEDFVKIWCDAASSVDLTQKDAVINIEEEEEITEWSDYIQSILRSEQKAYKKTPEDFENDMSVYEYGYTGHVYRVLLNILKSLNVFYTKSQMIWEVYRATSELIPYRDKHDTIRNKMPWLLYNAAVIVSRNYDEAEMHAQADKSDDNTNFDKDDYEYTEDSSAYNPDYFKEDADDTNSRNNNSDEFDYIEDSSAYNTDYFE